MERWLSTRRTVHGDPSVIRERLVSQVRTLLQKASGGPLTAPAGDGTFPVTLHSRGGRVSRAVEVTVSPVVELSSGLQIPLRWVARGMAAPLFPSFEGWIEMEHADSTSVTVSIVGRYRPPASVIGAVIDAAAMASTAEHTVEDLTVRLAELVGDVSAKPTAPSAGRMTVGDVMTLDPLTLTTDTSLRSAANLLLLGRISGFPVTDEEGRLVGMLSERDLLDKVAPLRTGLGRGVDESWRHHDAVTVGQACSRPVRTTEVDASLRDAAGVMARHGVGRLVVLRGAKIVGIITRRDVLKALVREDEATEDEIGRVLRETEQEDVRILVSDGMVRLEGTVDLRSRLAGLLGRVSEIDGVLDVDGEELTWRVDDVVVIPPMV